MRSQTPHSDGIGSQTTLYDVILVTLPLPFVVGVLLGRMTTLPTSLVVGVCGLVSVAVLAYGLFIAPPTTPLASNHVESPLDGVEASTTENAGQNRRRGSF
ncbi:hypothetical protein ACFQJC_04285 [Haloferax namakaokahaiae]|uniref:Cox cluster protein n=1 Tax=Haloferax namakaokahaiae TaxID=1748331 RepID=A0ABD5ZCC2_9EURY